jgi:hypothetical protein
MNLSEDEMRQLEELNRSAFDVDWGRFGTIPGRRWPSPRRLTTDAAVVALAVFLGALLDRLISPKGVAVAPGELLLASLTPVPRTDRGGEADRLETTADGSFALRPGSSFSLIISSPRSGKATVVLSSDDRTAIYPTREQRSIDIEAGKSYRYGPLRAPRSRTTAVAVVTDPEATETIRTLLAGPPPTASAPLASRIQDTLRKAGHPWIAINQVLVEPAPVTQADQRP